MLLLLAPLVPNQQYVSIGPGPGIIGRGGADEAVGYNTGPRCPKADRTRWYTDDRCRDRPYRASLAEGDGAVHLRPWRLSHIPHPRARRGGGRDDTRLLRGAEEYVFRLGRNPYRVAAKRRQRCFVDADAGRSFAWRRRHDRESVRGRRYRDGCRGAGVLQEQQHRSRLQERGQWRDLVGAPRDNQGRQAGRVDVVRDRSGTWHPPAQRQAGDSELPRRRRAAPPAIHTLARDL